MLLHKTWACLPVTSTCGMTWRGVGGFSLGRTWLRLHLVCPKLFRCSIVVQTDLWNQLSSWSTARIWGCVGVRTGESEPPCNRILKVSCCPLFLFYHSSRVPPFTKDTSFAELLTWCTTHENACACTLYCLMANQWRELSLSCDELSSSHSIWIGKIIVTIIILLFASNNKKLYTKW